MNARYSGCSMSRYTQFVLNNYPFTRKSLFSVVLNLSENNITRLDSSSFRGMRMMRRVYFNDNQISNIGRRTFQSLKREVQSSHHPACYNFLVSVFAEVVISDKIVTWWEREYFILNTARNGYLLSSSFPRPRQLPSTAACDFGDKYSNLNISDFPNKIKIKFA